MIESKILNRVIELIKKGWCQNHSAINANKESCYSGADEAVCWCSYGAMVRAHYEVCGNEQDATFQALDEMHELYAKIGNLVTWNDAPGRTQEEVIQFFESLKENHD